MTQAADELYLQPLQPEFIDEAVAVLTPCRLDQGGGAHTLGTAVSDSVQQGASTLIIDLSAQDTLCAASVAAVFNAVTLSSASIPAVAVTPGGPAEQLLCLCAIDHLTRCYPDREQALAALGYASVADEEGDELEMTS